MTEIRRSEVRNQVSASLSLALKRSKPFNGPLYVFLEVTNRCNLSCVMCGRTHDRRYKDQSFVGDMPFELVQKLKPFLGPATFVTATGLGEPFLHPEIIPLLTFLKRQEARVSLTSNGTVLSEGQAKALIESGVDRIVFSIDSPEPMLYERIRVGAKFQEVISNIERLSNMRSKSSDRKPYLILEFVAMSQNFHQLPELARLASDLDFDEVIVQNLFQHFEEGYNNFYQKNQLASVDRDEALAIWNLFCRDLEKRDIWLHSPFSNGGIQAYLRGEDRSDAVGKKSRRALWKGAIEEPAAKAFVTGLFKVKGWIQGQERSADDTEGKPGLVATLSLESPSRSSSVEVALSESDLPSMQGDDLPIVSSKRTYRFDEGIDVTGLEAGIYSLSLNLSDSDSNPIRLDRRLVLVQGAQQHSMYCTQPWSTIYVTWDGKIRTCCFHELELGDLNLRGFSGIWKGSYYRRFRRDVISGRVRDECMDCLAGRSNPNYIKPLREWVDERPMRQEALTAFGLGIINRWT